MKYIKLFFYYLYSTYFCLRYLPFSQAKKIPILIHPSVRILQLHIGDIVINGKLRKAMIVLGFKGSFGRCNRVTQLFVNRGGHLVFNGYTRLAKGCVLYVNRGTILFGKNNTFNSDCFFSCYEHISFGCDIMCGWNVSFVTTNGHVVIIDGNERKIDAPITIGNHVWIGSDSVINKNVNVTNNCIISHYSFVVSNLYEEYCIYGGHPAKKIKENADWKR